MYKLMIIDHSSLSLASMVSMMSIVMTSMTMSVSMTVTTVSTMTMAAVTAMTVSSVSVTTVSVTTVTISSMAVPWLSTSQKCTDQKLTFCTVYGFQGRWNIFNLHDFDLLHRTGIDYHQQDTQDHNHYSTDKRLHCARDVSSDLKLMPDSIFQLLFISSFRASSMKVYATSRDMMFFFVLFKYRTNVSQEEAATGSVERIIAFQSYKPVAIKIKTTFENYHFSIDAVPTCERYRSSCIIAYQTVSGLQPDDPFNT